ncbi:MAG: hypothetical protein QW461_08455 [Candidatus Jordarchaeales archaeon]
MDLDKAIVVVARRMNKRAEELRGRTPIVEVIDHVMSETKCKNYEEFFRILLENPRVLYDLASLRVKNAIVDSFLSMLFTEIFSRFGLGELGPLLLEAIKAGDKAEVKKIFLKVAEAVKEAEEKESKTSIET